MDLIQVNKRMGDFSRRGACRQTPRAPMMAEAAAFVVSPARKAACLWPEVSALPRLPFLLGASILSCGSDERACHFTRMVRCTIGETPTKPHRKRAVPTRCETMALDTVALGDFLSPRSRLGRDTVALPCEFVTQGPLVSENTNWKLP